MSETIPTKPYMVRAIHEWCVDNGFTPHVMVAVNSKTRVPIAYVKAGEIVLNLNYSATKELHIDNEAISFSARFGGISQNLYVPMDAVRGIFARENGQGMFFEVSNTKKSEALETNLGAASQAGETKPSEAPRKKPTLTVVK